MTSVITAATASLITHHLPLAASAIHGVFTSVASVQHPWASMATHVHDAAYYGPHCDPCACCIIIAECLCLTAICCPFLCPIVATSNYSPADEEQTWVAVSREEMPSLFDQEDVFEDGEYNHCTLEGKS